MSAQFSILPTTNSILAETAIVIILFFMFCIYVCYISAYNTGYKPNYVMFLNFIFDDYSGSNNFKKYIKNIVADTESFANFGNDNTVYSGLKINIQNKIVSFTEILKNFASKYFIKGNKIKLIRRI